MPRSSQIRIGISGWTYAPWRKVFYPKGVAQSRELEYASRMLNSIEVNGSFYSLQRPSSYQTWHDAVPDDFVFSLKGGRYITHIRRLKDVGAPLANFFASGIFALGKKLGPILWQFPPNMVFDAEKFERFFDMLPRDSKAAEKLAAKHDSFLKKDRVLTKAEVEIAFRYAVEIRHPSFENAAFIDLLRKHKIALVIADTAGTWPYTEDVTADFVYCRLHGSEELYASGYTPAALDTWAQKLKSWAAGKEPKDAKHWSDKKSPKASHRDLFVYFDNDVKVKAPFDAMALADRMGKEARGAGRDGSIEPPKLINKRLKERVRSHWPGVPKGKKK